MQKVCETVGDLVFSGWTAVPFRITVYFCKHFLFLPSLLFFSCFPSWCFQCISWLLCCLVLDKIIWVRFQELCCLWEVNVLWWAAFFISGEAPEVSPSCMWAWTWTLGECMCWTVTSGLVWARLCLSRNDKLLRLACITVNPHEKIIF